MVGLAQVKSMTLIDSHEEVYDLCQGGEPASAVTHSRVTDLGPLGLELYFKS